VKRIADLDRQLAEQKPAQICHRRASTTPSLTRDQLLA
jgi:hypothetical protein